MWLTNAGGFYSAEDADSLVSSESQEKVEGAFYVWEHQKIIETLGEEHGKLFCHHFG